MLPMPLLLGTYPPAAAEGRREAISGAQQTTWRGGAGARDGYVSPFRVVVRFGVKNTRVCGGLTLLWWHQLLSSK